MVFKQEIAAIYIPQEKQWLQNAADKKIPIASTTWAEGMLGDCSEL
jgi:hypothetical protein